MGCRNRLELAERASSNRGIRALLAALVAALVAGAGFMVWRRAGSKSQAPAEHKWAPPTPGPAAGFESGEDDEDSPDLGDDGFTAEVDAQAAKLAQVMVDSIETPDEEPKALGSPDSTGV